MEIHRVTKRVKKQKLKTKKAYAENGDEAIGSAAESGDDQYEEVEDEIEEADEQLKDNSYHNQDRNDDQLSNGIDAKQNQSGNNKNIMGLKMPTINKLIFQTNQVDRNQQAEYNDNSSNKVTRNANENEDTSQITTARRIEDESKNAQSQPIFEITNVNQEED